MKLLNTVTALVVFLVLSAVFATPADAQRWRKSQIVDAWPIKTSTGLKVQYVFNDGRTAVGSLAGLSEPVCEDCEPYVFKQPYPSWLDDWNIWIDQNNWVNSICDLVGEDPDWSCVPGLPATCRVGFWVDIDFTSSTSPPPTLVREKWDGVQWVPYVNNSHFQFGPWQCATYKFMKFRVKRVGAGHPSDPWTYLQLDYGCETCPVPTIVIE